MGSRLERGVREKIRGGTTNTNNHLRGHIEAYYCRSILKYIHVLKNLNVITK